MFCADRAAKVQRNCMDDLIHRFPLVEIGGGIGADRLGQVEVDIAIADMTERHRTDTGHRPCDGVAGARDEIRHPADRYGNIVLDRAAFEFLRLDDRLANEPEGGAFGLALGQGRVDDQAIIQPGRQRGLDGGSQLAALGPGGRLDQHIPWVRRGERIDNLVDMLEGEAQQDARDKLETHQRVAGRDPQSGEQLDRRLWVGHGDEGGLDLARSRKQLQHRRGDDAQRPFPADEEMFQIIAGIILVQPSQAIPDSPVRHHRLDAEDQLAHIAVADGHGSARIGR